MAQSPLAAVAALTNMSASNGAAPDIDLRELEAAAVIMVSCAHTDTHEAQALVARASAVISQLYSVPDAHIVCLRLLLAATEPPARFFALQALAQFVRTDAYALMREDARATVRNTLLANAAAIVRDPAYVRNKLSVVFAGIVAADFPERWPNAFEEMMRVFTGDVATLEFFMRVLMVIHEEIVQPRVARSGTIKDAMRMSATAALAELWYRTLTTYASRVPRLCALVLHVAALYVEWIDIRLIAQPDFIDLLLNIALTGSLPVDPSTGMVHGSGSRVALQGTLRAGAAKVLYCLLSKGMDITARLSLMGVLRVDNIIASVSANPGMLEPSEEGDDLADELQLDDFGLIICDLIAFVGVTLITAGETPAVLASADAAIATASSLRAVTSLLITLLATQDAALCGRLLQFFTEMINCFAREARVSMGGGVNGVSPVMAGNAAGGLQAPPSPPTSALGATPGASRREKEKVPRAFEGRPAGVSFVDYLPTFLDALAMRFTYPVDFAFDADDEDETDVRALRDGLRKVFVNAVKAAPDLILGHLVRSPHVLGGDTLAVLQSGTSPWQRTELILSLLFYFGEGSQNVNAALRSGTGDLFTVLLAVFTATLPSSTPVSGAAAAPHHSVLLRYYECVERYNGLLLSRPDFLPLVLTAMLGPTGLRHTLPAVRARTCYLLMRTVKTLVRSDGAGRVLEPYCDAVLAQIADLLVVPFVSREVMATASAGTSAPARPGPAGSTAGEDKRVRVASFDGVLNVNGTSGGTRGPSGLGPDDQQFLFELVGVLLGAPWMPADKKLIYTQAAMTPLCEQMETGLAQLAAVAGSAGTDTSGWSADMVSEVAAWIVRNLNALANISKGFGGVAQIEPLALLLERALSGALRALALLPSHPAVRNKSLFMLHRMVECLETRLLPHLPLILGLVLPAPTMDDLQQALVLVNQLVGRFKQDIVPALAPQLPSLVTRVLTLLPDVDSSVAVIGASAASSGALKTATSSALPSISTRLTLRPSGSDLSTDGASPGLARGTSAPQVIVANDDARARIDLQRAYVLLFSQSATHGVITPLLLSEAVLPHRWEVLTSVLTQIGNVSDLTVARTALQFASALVRIWLPVQGIGGDVVSPGGTRPADATRGAATPAATPTSPTQVRSIPDSSPLPPALWREFISYLLTTVVPLTFQLGAAPAFDARDLQAQGAAGEIINLHCLIGLHAAAALVGAQTPVPPLPSAQLIGVDLLSAMLETAAHALKPMLAPLGEAAVSGTVNELARYFTALQNGLNTTAAAPSVLSADKAVRNVVLTACGAIKSLHVMRRQATAKGRGPA